MPTAFDLLAERRQCIEDMRRERDRIERDLIRYRIDEIDRELHSRLRAIPVNPPPSRDAIGEAFAAARESVATEPMTDINWSPAQRVRRAS